MSRRCAPEWQAPNRRTFPTLRLWRTRKRGPSTFAVSYSSFLLIRSTLNATTKIFNSCNGGQKTLLQPSLSQRRRCRMECVSSLGKPFCFSGYVFSKLSWIKLTNFETEKIPWCSRRGLRSMHWQACLLPIHKPSHNVRSMFTSKNRGNAFYSAPQKHSILSQQP